MKRHGVLIIVASLPLLGPATASPQSAAISTNLPAFDAATIKPADPGMGKFVGLEMSPGRLKATNLPLRDLIMFAYDVTSPSQISGDPDWVVSSRFDIEAKEDAETAAAIKELPKEERTQRVRLMVQALLAERFNLKVDRATKEIPVYALVVAKGGPKLQESSASPSGSPRRGGGFNIKPGELQSVNATLDQFADGILSRQPEVDGRVVLNKTGLTGRYDFTLKWTPEIPPGGPEGQGDGVGPTQTARSAPGLLTALEEELGLKLESQKGLVEVLVIAHVERPSAN